MISHEEVSDQSQHGYFYRSVLETPLAKRAFVKQQPDLVEIQSG